MWPGGKGEVYRARDTKLKRDIALRSCTGFLLATPSAWVPFEREAKVRVWLKHPREGVSVLVFPEAPAKSED